MDNMTTTQRSLTMSRIRSKETQPEKKLRSCLHKAGYRFRKNVKEMPGTPDIVLPKYKTVIFVHGCFWHQHKNCPKAVKPKTNIKYWNKKLLRNIERDKLNKILLHQKGWNVIEVWECEINQDVYGLLAKLKSLLAV